MIKTARHTFIIARGLLCRCAKKSQDSLRKRVALFFASKILRSFDAIIVLCENGFCEDAEIVARSLLEAYAKACYIEGQQDPEAAARELLEFWHKKIAKVFRRVQEYPDTFYEEFLQKFDPSKKIRSYRVKKRLWPEKPIHEIFRSVGEETFPVCREWYDLASDVVHSNARVIPEYLDTHNNFRPFSLCGPASPDSRSDRLLHCLCAIIMLMTEGLCSTFAVSMPKESDEIHTRLCELESHVLRKVT